MKLGYSPIAQSSANGYSSAISSRSAGGADNGEVRQLLFPDLFTAPGDFCTKIGGLLESSHASSQREQESASVSGKANSISQRGQQQLVSEEGAGEQATRGAEAEDVGSAETNHSEVKSKGGGVRLAHKTPLSEATSAIEKLGDMISKSISEQDKKDQQDVRDAQAANSSHELERRPLVHEIRTSQDGRLPAHLYSENPNAIDPVKSASGALLSVGDFLMKKTPEKEKPTKPLQPPPSQSDAETSEKTSSVAMGKDLTNTLMLVLDPSLHARSSQVPWFPE